MGNKGLRYVGLDFETTGLDVRKDEVIQIGLIEIENGKLKDGKMEIGKSILSEYKSLVKPVGKQDDLKSIVGFITGLKIEDLEKAPRFKDIKDEVEKYFDEKTIVIGHNIQFDIDFLKKYIPDIKYYMAIDTFDLSQTLVHYAPSYALEVLIEYVKSKDEKFGKLFDSFHDNSSGKTFHDALYDAKCSLALFVYFADYIKNLSKKYQSLTYFLKNHSIRKNIIDCKNRAENSVETIELPALNRIVAGNIALSEQKNSTDIKKLENLKKFYVGNIPLKNLITRILSNKNLIFTFSNKQKLDIVKNILNEIGIKNIGFAKEEQTINYTIFKSFLNKKTFSDQEINFILKYLSHLEKGYGVLDLNNTSDYQIYYFLKDTRSVLRYPILLTTHQGFFSMINQNKSYEDYSLCFFDSEYRYKSYNFYLSTPCDLYYTLNFVEMLMYTYEARNQIKQGKYDLALNFLYDFSNFFQIFIGNLFIETKKLFIKIQDDRLSYDPIIDNSNFRITNLLFKTLQEKKADFQKYLLEEDSETFERHIQQIENVFNSLVTISKRMYDGDNFYFVYSESTNFTSWQEFVEKIENRHTLFFSNTNKQFECLDERSDFVPTIKYHKISQIDKVVDFVKNSIDSLQEPQTIFIVSTQKYQSQNIFDLFLKQDTQKKALLLVENITGGAGKNIFNAKQKQHKILIGGYQFLLNTFSNKIHIDNCIVFNISGANEQGILDDIKWYGA